MSTAATSINRESRAAAAFASEFSEEHRLTPADAQRLAESTASVLEWLTIFRRSLAVAKKYPADHPHREESRRRVTIATAEHLDKFSELELHFFPDHTRTREGFQLPSATEQELAAYTFFPFYRDGVEMIRLRRGCGREEIDTIVSIVASGGRRLGDDAFLWLWQQRFPSVDIRVEPKLNAKLSIALAVRGSLSVSANAFLATFHAAAPHFAADNGRPKFTTDSLELLAERGLDPVRAEAMLGSMQPETMLPQVSREAVEAARVLLLQKAERDARLEALRRQHFGLK